MEHIKIDGGNFRQYSRELFDILADNMTKIAPTGNSREQDFATWVDAVHQRLEREACGVTAFRHAGGIVAYFQYSSRDNILFIEEVEIKSDFQRRYNILGKMIKLLPDIVPPNTRFVRAYANKNNNVSLENLRKAGFEIVGTSKNGRSYLHEADYTALTKRFKING